MLSPGNKAGSNSDIASGSDSDCSSVISSPDDPSNPSFPQPSSSSLQPTSASGGGKLFIKFF